MPRPAAAPTNRIEAAISPGLRSTDKLELDWLLVMIYGIGIRQIYLASAIDRPHFRIDGRPCNLELRSPEAEPYSNTADPESGAGDLQILISGFICIRTPKQQ